MPHSTVLCPFTYARMYSWSKSNEFGQADKAIQSGAVYGQFLREAGRTDQAGEMEARAAEIQRANAPPARSDTAPGVYKIGGEIKAPSVLHKVEPEYSEEARTARLQGTVIVQVVIGTNGVAGDSRIVKGLGLGLDEQAIEAISQWQFKPGVRDGQPVPVAATIEVNWRLL